MPDGTTAAVRGCALVALLLAIAGCGSSELRDRYDAERMFWRASRESQRLNLGQQVLADKELERARAAYAGILERFPPEQWASRTTPDGSIVARIGAEAMFRQAELLASAKRQEDARKMTAEIRRLFPRENIAVRATYLEALVLRVEEKGAEAAALVAAIPKSHSAVLADGQLPDEGVLEAPLVAARWYANDGDADAARRTLAEAETLYEQVIRERPGTRAALYARVRLFTAQASRGSWENSIRTMEEILADSTFIAEDPGGEATAMGRLRVADIYAGPLGQPEAALAEVRKLRGTTLSKELAPRVDIAEAQVLLLAGRGREGLETLDRVIAQNPHDIDLCAQAYYTRGSIYEQLGEWDRALAEFRTLVRNYPRTPLGLSAPLEIVARYRRVGDTQGGANALARAIEDYRRVIELDPDSREALIAREYMAGAYAAQDDWDQAAAALGDIASEAAGSMAGAEALWREAWIYEEKMGQIDEAERRLKQIVTSYPNTEVAGRARTRLDELSRRRPADAAAGKAG